jgi:hypothetical protein
MFAALCKQRNEEFKRQLWLQYVVVAGIFNAQRTDNDQHWFTPWDFMPREDYDPEREKIIATLKALMRERPLNSSQLVAFRDEWTKTLAEKGRTDVTQIMDAVFKGVTLE